MVSDQATINILNWDGSLSSSDFYVAACAFAEKWKKFNSSLPEWSWVRCLNGCNVAASKVDGYLALQNMPLPRSLEEEQDEGNLHGKEVPGFSDTDEPSDTALLVPSNDPNMHLYDFHVANSPSYRVPVLYFRAYTTDGQPLTLDDIEKDLPPNFAKILMESKWTFITQVEHPYLNRPWYTLHPCGTSEWLKLLFTNQSGVPLEQYLACASFSPAVQSSFSGSSSAFSLSATDTAASESVVFSAVRLKQAKNSVLPSAPFKGDSIQPLHWNPRFSTPLTIFSSTYASI